MTVLGWALIHVVLWLLFFAIIKATDKPVQQPDTQRVNSNIDAGLAASRQTCAEMQASTDGLRACGQQLARSIEKERSRQPGDRRTA